MIANKGILVQCYLRIAVLDSLLITLQLLQGFYLSDLRLLFWSFSGYFSQFGLLSLCTGHRRSSWKMELILIHTLSSYLLHIACIRYILKPFSFVFYLLTFWTCAIIKVFFSFVSLPFEVFPIGWFRQVCLTLKGRNHALFYKNLYLTTTSFSSGFITLRWSCFSRLIQTSSRPLTW